MPWRLGWDWIEDVVRTGSHSFVPNHAQTGVYGSRPLWYDGRGGILLQAGARSGKFRDWIGYLACGVGCEDDNMLVLDEG